MDQRMCDLHYTIVTYGHKYMKWKETVFMSGALPEGNSELPSWHKSSGSKVVAYLVLAYDLCSKLYQK